MTSFLVLAILLASPDAGPSASDSGAETVLLKVGEKAKVQVGNLKGVNCDDLAIVEPNLEGGEASNVLTLKGLKKGTTLCRAGGPIDGRYKLVSVTVSDR